jgi:hypothetical protein
MKSNPLLSGKYIFMLSSLTMLEISSARPCFPSTEFAKASKSAKKIKRNAEPDQDVCESP